jgi:hypothetical protein
MPLKIRLKSDVFATLVKTMRRATVMTHNVRAQDKAESKDSALSSLEGVIND